MSGRVATHLSAAQIRAARALLNWSQEDLADLAELSVNTIRKLELGYISPRGKTVDTIRRSAKGMTQNRNRYASNSPVTFLTIHKPTDLRYHPESHWG